MRTRGGVRMVVAKMVVVHGIRTEHRRAFLTHVQARQNEKSHIRRKMSEARLQNDDIDLI